jgi:hypothetical protein
MNHDDDTDDTDAPMTVDPVAVVLAATDLVDSIHRFCKLALTDKTKKARLRALAEIDWQAADAVAARDEARRETGEIVEAAQAEVKAIQADARQRLDAAATAEQELVERAQKIARLESAWRNIGEPADVMSGFRSPEFSPLQKARLAHGQQPGKDPDRLLFVEHDAASDQDIAAYIRRDVGDERSDAQGNAFAPSTLTRSTEHKRGAA